MNRRIRLATIAVVAALAAGAGLAGAQTIASKPQEWDRETLRLAGTLPVQEDGRVKPLSTYADFALLRLNGHRGTRNLDGDPITSMVWLMDCLFYPDAARQYKCFLVTDSEALDAIQVSHEGKKKRDRYSYNELEKGIPELFRLAGQYSQKEAKDLTPLESQIINLAHNVNEFERITHFLDFARHDFLKGGAARLQELVKGTEDTEFAAILSNVPTLRALGGMLEQGVEDVDPKTLEQERHQLEHVLRDISTMASAAQALALLPPEDPKALEWLTPGDVAQMAFTQPQPPQRAIDLLASLEKVVPLRDNPERFQAQLAEFHDKVIGVAEERGEYAKIPLEHFFYQGHHRALLFTAPLYIAGAALLVLLLFRPKALWAAAMAPVLFAVPTLFLGYPFFWALSIFVLSFVAMAALWMRPQNPFLNRLVPILIVAPTLLLVAGITMRCIIRNRPPVTTLYETILFITAVTVIVALIIEWTNRQKLALSVASFLGVAGLFLANRYEAAEGVDTMPTLVAVLDTNFWLWTHVTTVTMGYAAGLLAAAIAHIYIIGKLLGLRRGDKPFYKTVTRMTYGVLCFGLFFAILGTVLGGIWANESWGRFWGWDPKENGALMIVLWMLAILHARMGGYIRDLGLAVSAVFGGIVVAFSWWGVNLLGVGLHSYGFTSGAARGLAIFYGIEALVILMGAVVYMRQRVTVHDTEAETVPAPARAKGSPRPAKG